MSKIGSIYTQFVTFLHHTFEEVEVKRIAINNENCHMDPIKNYVESALIQGAEIKKTLLVR